MSGGTYEHSVIKSNLVRHLGNALDETPCRPLDSDMRVRSPDRRSSYPDASVLCGEPDLYNESRDVLLNPRVIFDGLSRSTRGADTRRRFMSYSEITSLEEYVVIEQTKPAVMIYRRDDNSEEWRMKIVQGVDTTFSLQSLGIELSLSSIYDSVDFETDREDDSQKAPEDETTGDSRRV